MGANAKLDPENVGKAVGISLISCLEADMHLKFRGRHLGFFHFRFGRIVFTMSPNGKLDPENIGVAVGILLISCLEAEI